MAWTTAARVDRVLGSSTLRQKLFAVDGTYDATSFAQAELGARASIVSYLMYAGYADPGATLTADSVTEGYLAPKCEALMLMKAFPMAKGIAWPVGKEDWAKEELRELYDRRLPVPGLTPSTTAGIGAVVASETSLDVTDSRPQIMNRKQTQNW